MIDYRILTEKTLIVICNWGETTVEDVVKFSQSLQSDADFSQNHDAIIDNTQLERQYTFDEVDALARPRIDTRLSAGKVAIVASADITYGISRMYEMISATRNPQQIGVFRGTRSALNWLGREGLDIEGIFEEIKGR